MGVNYDFSGWATKNDLLCSDGRTIKQDAFKECDGVTVPLVWNHIHDDPGNVLGHALLENRPEGVYTYCSFNDTDAGQQAKALVQHGDVNSLSINANKLKHKGHDVVHGVIREVSLVLAGANPGAVIDFPILSHNDEYDESEAEISIGYMNVDLTLAHADKEDEEEMEEKDSEEEPSEEKEESKKKESKEDESDDKAEEKEKPKEEESEKKEEEEEIKHQDSNKEEKMADNEKTVQDVFDELTEEQKNVVYFMIGQALEDAGVEAGDEGEEGEDMKHNVFDADTTPNDVLSHSDMENIFKRAKSSGSLKEAVEEYLDGGQLMHAIPTEGMELPEPPLQEYGFQNPNMLFPEYKAFSNTPEWIKRDTDWVQVVMAGVHKTPFTRIKSVFANITEDEARAKGYMKGKMKKEEVFSLLKRKTDPQTIYKKQKLDRDDVIDITDFDVVSWIRGEMEIMLDEEIARAILIGDGRIPSDDDHISEEHIRPVVTDKPLFNIKSDVAGADGEELAKNFIKQAVRARKSYKGSGNPILFTTEDMLTEMLLLEDEIGHRLYKSEAELATAMRVSRIVTVPVFENVTVDEKEFLGVALNLNDYALGADKGGEKTLFDDFDIDYNQMKYLIETRRSGALVKPFSAMTFTKANG